VKPIKLPLATIALFLTALSAPVFAGAAEGPGSSRSIVLNPLAATTVQDLDFGHLIPGTTAGTVVINPVNSARSTTGGTMQAGGTTSAAIFIGVARPNRMVVLNLPNGQITLSNGTGGTMTVGNFTTDGVRNRRTDANGIVSFRVAARLNVAANQADGAYSGTFDVTLNLQ
jgi:hypothetical protein